MGSVCCLYHHWPSLCHQLLWLLVSLASMVLSFLYSCPAPLLGIPKAKFVRLLVFLHSMEFQEMLLGTHLTCLSPFSSNLDALRRLISLKANVHALVSISRKRRDGKMCVWNLLAKLVASPVALGIQRRTNVWILYKLGWNVCLCSREHCACCVASWEFSEKNLREGRLLSTAKWSPETRNLLRSV